jgi:hypothetical protein
MRSRARVLYATQDWGDVDARADSDGDDGDDDGVAGRFCRREGARRGHLAMLPCGLPVSSSPLLLSPFPLQNRNKSPLRSTHQSEHTVGSVAARARATAADDPRLDCVLRPPRRRLVSFARARKQRRVPRPQPRSPRLLNPPDIAEPSALPRESQRPPPPQKNNNNVASPRVRRRRRLPLARH